MYMFAGVWLKHSTPLVLLTFLQVVVLYLFADSCFAAVSSDMCVGKSCSGACLSVMSVCCFFCCCCRACGFVIVAGSNFCQSWMFAFVS